MIILIYPNSFLSERSKSLSLLKNDKATGCKVRLVGAWIKRTVVVIGARRIRSEKLRKHQYIEGYAWSPDSNRVEWDENKYWSR